MILAALRTGTADRHAWVERVMDLPARLAGRDRYATLLGRLYGYYQPVEAALAAAAAFHPHGFDCPARFKAGLLRRDLAALGAPADEVPRCTRLPDLDTREDVLGVLYVLEGATLGGRVVRKLVHDRLGLTATTGCAFFSGHGDRVGPMWQEFCGVLARDADALPPATARRVVAAAETAFDTLGHWLEGGEAR